MRVGRFCSRLGLDRTSLVLLVTLSLAPAPSHIAPPPSVWIAASLRPLAAETTCARDPSHTHPSHRPVAPQPQPQPEQDAMQSIEEAPAYRLGLWLRSRLHHNGLWLREEVLEVLNIPLPHAGGGYLENPAQPLPRGYHLPKRPALSRFFVLRGSRRGVAGMEDRSGKLSRRFSENHLCGAKELFASPRKFFRVSPPLSIETLRKSAGNPVFSARVF